MKFFETKFEDYIFQILKVLKNMKNYGIQTLKINLLNGNQKQQK